MTPVRRLLATVASTLLALGAVAGPAEAAAYRYWSYWHGEDGRWTYATTGPGGRQPADGAVEGWRFAVSPEGGGVGPRQPADFRAVCAGVPAEEGTKRVALVVDFGTPQDAPPGERPPRPRSLCVLADREASGEKLAGAVDAYAKDEAGADRPAALANLVLAARALGEDPQSFGETDLVERLTATGPAATEGRAAPTDGEAAGQESGDEETGSADDSPAAGLVVGAGILVLLLAAGVLLFVRLGRRS